MIISTPQPSGRDITPNHLHKISYRPYSGGGGVGFTFDGSNTALQETTLGLTGGVTVSVRSGSAQVWSYPNLHGDVTVTADENGARAAGPVAIYDPFGDPINLTTGQIGTLTANATVPANTTTPGASYGWEGSHLKQDQTTGDISTIEMGARQYVPTLGRFLSVDPIAGGNVNDYNYPNDPINGSDLSGRWSWGDTWAVVGIVALVVVSVVLTVSVVGSVGDVATGAGIAALGADIAADTAIEAGAEAEASEAGEGFLYRGVTESHPAADDAADGVAEPRGGNATPEEHNAGNTKSDYTSWTTRQDEAMVRATKNGRTGGYLLRVAVKDVANQLVRSPDRFNEGEWLLRGRVSGAVSRFVHYW